MRLMAPLLLLAACSGKIIEPDSVSPEVHVANQIPPTTTSPDVTTGSINMTGLMLQQQLFTDPTRNEVFSPASISVAFAMLAAGAEGQTADQLYTFLNERPETAHVNLGGMVKTWNDPGNEAPLTLAVANRIWLGNTVSVRDSYLALTRDQYGTEATTLDFVSAPEVSRETINSWVEENTNDRIQDLLPQGSVSTATRMVLTNAVYFKADWAVAFDAARTEDKPFLTASDQTVMVPTMHAERSMEYAETDTARMVMVPYMGGTADFIIALPKRASLSDLEASMTAETIDGWVAAARPSMVNLDLPKFELNASYSSLAAALAALGVTDAFSGRADFSGITDSTDLIVSGAVHKAFILVDETGTEAAAATGIIMRARSVVQPPPPVEFHADQPFWFAVRDRATGTLLFTGHVADPAAEG
ncbi:MAG: serpin B [Myxococcota bacterium]|jgi:serpin B